jgi:cytochrome c oxidase subunit 2
MSVGHGLLRQAPPVMPGAIPWDWLFVTIMVIAAAVVLLVAGLVTAILVRYRRRPGEGPPPQSHGNQRLEIGWTVAPAAIVAVIFALTIGVMRAGPTPGTDPPAGQPPDIQVIGRQWWWEARYPQAGVVTANVIYVPVGKRLLVTLDSDNVQHSFWVPELGQKMDMYPGRTNYTWLEAPAPGAYQGACAEFCGVQHAWMRILVIALPQAEYDAWLAAQQRPAQPPASASAQAGAALFERNACGSCHAIAGTPHQGRAAPDLTHFAARPTISAGVLANTPENLARYLRDPQAVKPGIVMPNAQLGEEEIAALVAYLEGLR